MSPLFGYSEEEGRRARWRVVEALRRKAVFFKGCHCECSEATSGVPNLSSAVRVVFGVAPERLERTCGCGSRRWG